MNEADPQRVEYAVHRVQTGVRETAHGNEREWAVGLANEIAPFSTFGSASEFKSDAFNPTLRTVRRLRKFTEIIEDNLGVDLGHSKFARVASGLTTISSLGSIFISANNLIRVSVSLRKRYETTQDLREVQQRYYTNFYEALAIFAVDCMLYWSPLSYRTAWVGTRVINNRYLYRLRNVSPNLHRYVLSEVHYIIRGVVPDMLHAATHYSQYLVDVSVRTFETLWESSKEDIGPAEVSRVINTMLQEYEDFVEMGYGITTPAVDWDSIVSTILAEVKEITGMSLWSIDDVRGQSSST